MERVRKEEAKGGKESSATKEVKELSPTIKEKERKERSTTKEKERKERSIRDSDFARNISCHICLTRGDHTSVACRYRYRYPAGAAVGSFAQIVCMCCGKVKPHRGKPGIDWDARVELKPAFSYPSVEEELAELKKKASKSEAAVDGTGN